MLRDWNRRNRTSRSQNDAVGKFLAWAQFWALEMPVPGEDVAVFLLELLEGGAPVVEIRRAAAAVISEYERRGVYLDRRPIRTALRLIADQTAPGRVIH